MEVVSRTLQGHFLESASPIMGPDGSAIAATLAFQEVTAFVEQLSRTDQDLEACVHERTHELLQANQELQREIAERSAVQEALRASEAKFRAIAEVATDCIYCQDTDFRLTYVNPSMAELFGASTDGLLGQTQEDLFGVKAASTLTEVDRRVLSGETVELELKRKVREVPVVLHDVKVPMRDESGQIIGICGISRNITDGRRLLARQPHDIDYSSSAMKAVQEEALLAAASDSLVLLLGESGCGKDHLARYIHDHSSRADSPYFSLNCAALPPELAESELFGHEAGAFTGARSRTKGLLELAEGGTLLLNEIAELAPALQAKLLGFLDKRSFTRVGGRRDITVNARLMAATNRDLEQEVEEGRFRKDLYYRLQVMVIRMPPLRERLDDLPVLVEKLMAQIASEVKRPQVPRIDSTGMRALRSYHWPGNVRELRNVLERAVIVSQGPRLEVTRVLPSPESRSWMIQVPFPESGTLYHVSQDVKRQLILEALNRSNGNRGKAAVLLGISRFALKRQMTSLGLLGTKDKAQYT